MNYYRNEPLPKSGIFSCTCVLLISNMIFDTDMKNILFMDLKQKTTSTSLLYKKNVTRSVSYVSYFILMQSN